METIWYGLSLLVCFIIAYKLGKGSKYKKESGIESRQSSNLFESDKVACRNRGCTRTTSKYSRNCLCNSCDDLMTGLT